MGVRLRDHGNLNMKRNWVTTLQAIAALNELLLDKANVMPNKSYTLPNGQPTMVMVLVCGTKWKVFLATINQVSIVLLLVYLHMFPFDQVCHFATYYIGYVLISPP